MLLLKPTLDSDKLLNVLDASRTFSKLCFCVSFETQFKCTAQGRCINCRLYHHNTAAAAAKADDTHSRNNCCRQKWIISVTKTDNTPRVACYLGLLWEELWASTRFMIVPYPWSPPFGYHFHHLHVGMMKNAKFASFLANTRYLHE